MARMTTTTESRASLSNSIRAAVEKSDSKLLSIYEAASYGDPCRTQPRLAIYARVSRTSGTSSSIDAQRTELEELVSRLEGRYDRRDDYFEDADVSAKGGKFRPSLEELLVKVEQGHYDGVLVWEFSRWTRNRGEHRFLADLLRRNACELYSKQEPWLTLYGPIGFIVDWAAELAAKESERISDRVRRWHNQRFKVGASTARAPFGMTKFEVPSPWEGRKAPIRLLKPDDKAQKALGLRSPADLIREAYVRIDSGHSVISIIKEWNEAGYPSPTGGAWFHTTLTGLLTNPVMAGFATRRQEIVLDVDQEPVRAHLPVIDEDIFNRVKLIFDEREPAARHNDSPLRGLLRCGNCGRTLVFHRRKDRGGPPEGVTSYYCQPSKNVGRRCKRRSSISAPPTISAVLDVVAELLADEDRLRQVLTPVPSEKGDQARAELRRTQQALERLERMNLDGDFSDVGGDERYRTLHDELAQRAADANAQLVRATPRTLPPAIVEALAVPDTVRDVLEGMHNAERRRLLGILIKHIVVHPSTIRGNRFDPSRLDIEWHTT